MKRSFALILLIISLLTFTLTACDSNENTVERTDYIINGTETICIGAILPETESGSRVEEGLNYAQSLASKIRLDKNYEIEISVKTTEELDSAFNEFSEKVAAVICLGCDSKTTDSITDKFSTTQTPLIFLDNFSDSIKNSHNAFSISISNSYQVSAAIKYISENGLKNGTLILTEENESSKSFEEIFINTAKNASISTTAYYSENKKGLPAELAESEFVFINGPVDNCASLIKTLKHEGFTGEIIISEVIDKKIIQNNDFEDVVFINKFEYDNDNYIGSDFLNQFTKLNGTSATEMTAATAYGYDAYMLIYEALHSFSAHSDLMSAVGNSSSEKSEKESSDIFAGEILSAINTVTFHGVTEDIIFDENGLTQVKFLYIDRIQAQEAVKLSKYKF